MIEAEERARRMAARAAADNARREARQAATVVEQATTAGETDPGPPSPPGSVSVVLRRRFKQYRPREVEWLPVTADARDLLAVLRPEVERVYMTGPRPEPIGWAQVELPEGWQQGAHYLHGHSPVWRFTRGRRRLEVHRAAGWLGEGDYTPDEARAAMGIVDETLRESVGIPMLASAATTGRAVLERMIPPGDWPCLPDELQELIRSTAGQGRWQPSAHGGLLVPAGDELAGLHEYDGRFMYAALCWGLGSGPAVHDHGTDFLGQRRGRYRVTWAAPEGWAEVGILPMMEPGGGPRAWHYPERGTGWVDGSELLLAAKHGWTFTVHERLLLADRKPCPDPMGKWAAYLIKAREAAVCPEDARVTRLARACWRSMLLFTIGTLHGRPHSVTRVCRVEDARQAPGSARLSPDGSWLSWGEDRPAAWPAMSHPEWSAAIWARARCRLLSGPGQTGALHLSPRNRVVGFRTDAVYVERREPRWEANDDGQAGRLRHEGGTDGAVSAPGSSRDLLNIRDSWRNPK